MSSKKSTFWTFLRYSLNINQIAAQKFITPKTY